MWRDPLDDLIEDVERTLPAEPDHPACDLPSVADVQIYFATLLYDHVPTPAELQIIERVEAYYERRVNALTAKSVSPAR